MNRVGAQKMRWSKCKQLLGYISLRERDRAGGGNSPLVGNQKQFSAVRVVRAVAVCVCAGIDQTGISVAHAHVPTQKQVHE